MYQERAAPDVAGPMVESRYRDTAVTAVPAMGNGLYRPQRDISWPLPMEATSTPAIRGSICRPEPVGLAPLTANRRPPSLCCRCPQVRSQSS